MTARSCTKRPLAILAAASIFLMAGCAGSSGADDDALGADLITADNPYALPEDWSETITYEFGPFPEGSLFARGAEALIASVEELSDGQMTFDVSYGQALFASNETVMAIRDGIADLAHVQFSSEPSGWDYQTTFGTALSTPIADHRPGVGELAAFAAAAEAGFEDEAMAAEYERQGVVPLVPQVVTHDAYNQLCTTKVTSLEDAQGKIIRIPGPVWESEAKSLGFSPVSIPPLEQFEALQRGVVDCVVGPLRDWALLDLFSAANYLLVDDEAAFTGNISAFIANPQWYDSLPAGAQNILHAATFEYMAAYAQASVQRDIVSAQAVAAGSGDHEIDTMDSDYREQLEQAQATAYEKAISSPPGGVDGSALEESLENLDTKFQDWTTFLEGDEEVGGTFPSTYEEFFPWAADLDEEFSAPAWKERLWKKVFEPTMPHQP